MQPSEFWSSTPEEFWWEFDYKMKVQKRITKRKDGFSEADWEAARKEHTAKMKEQHV